MGRVGMDEEGCYQGPDTSGQEIVQAEDEVLVCEAWILLLLLPGVETGKYAGEDEEPVNPQRMAAFRLGKSGGKGYFRGS